MGGASDALRGVGLHYRFLFRVTLCFSWFGGGLG